MEVLFDNTNTCDDHHHHHRRPLEKISFFMKSYDIFIVSYLFIQFMSKLENGEYKRTATA